ncbi:hypothetical protein [Flavobacterium sp. MDT1-60]|uniref:hypothetical protein n=1 Tax=Flavobacterium sp. MDT1-60 TaxID=1979344 RepID=UPI00177FEC94|nr:hypothetical protein [Flavobacterium sp. MDT1-60]QOG01009.1 hypothetical protein IHE43_14430 [Flavobacterium sp. MDT1-60]
MKKTIRPINVVFFLWALILIAVTGFYPEYKRDYLWLSLIVIIPVIIIDFIKKKKEDKLNDTTEFQSSIYRMLIMGVMLLVFFLITKQNDI